MRIPIRNEKAESIIEKRDEYGDYLRTTRRRLTISRFVLKMCMNNKYKIDQTKNLLREDNSLRCFLIHLRGELQLRARERFVFVGHCVVLR